MSSTPVVGTWIRSLVAVSDSGDHNDRHAPAGALGRIEDSRESTSRRDAAFVVVFYPSFIVNNWTAAEIEEEAVILPADHPDIPSAAAFDFTSAVADLVAEGDLDEVERTIYVTDELVGRILGNAHVTYDDAPEVNDIVRSGIRSDGLALSFESFDRLAEIACIGDRSPRPELTLGM